MGTCGHRFETWSSIDESRISRDEWKLRRFGRGARQGRRPARRVSWYPKVMKVTAWSNLSPLPPRAPWRGR